MQEFVIPANAGIHFHTENGVLLKVRMVAQFKVKMGPCVRRDDGGTRSLSQG